MKHLKRFFESTDFSKEDILENFLFITDKLGDPEIYSSKFGNSSKWIIRWDLKIDLSVLQEASELISKLKELTEDIDDVLTAADRIGEYNINMSITDLLILEMVPKDTGNNEFNFIKGYDSRILYVRKNEIERFFNSRGIRVVKWDNESSYNEYNQTNDLDIHLSKNDISATDDFKRLVNIELRKIDDREYECSGGGSVISICPLEEKAYVEMTLN
jgi:hypothetical protein